MPELLFNPARFPELTYNDVCLVPHNSVVQRLHAVARPEECECFRRLHRDWRKAANRSRVALSTARHRGHPHVQPLQRRARDARRAFQDALIALTQKYPTVAQTLSRDAVDFAPVDGFGKTPVVVANMNQVSGKRMAETVARMGATAIIPQDKLNPEMRQIIADVHGAHPAYDTPVTVRVTTKVHELLAYLDKRDAEDTAVVLDGRDQLIGVISRGDVPQGVNTDAEIRFFVRHADVTTAPEGTPTMEAIALMRRKNIHLLPIIRRETRAKVVGVLTLQHAGLSLRYTPHRNVHGRLAVAAAISALNKRPVDRARAFIDMGADAIVVDAAHFDQGVATYAKLQEVCRLAERVRNAAIRETRRKVFIVAGNVVTADATADILAAGADAAKVGIGPGAMCETRMVSGVGRPQFTAVLQCAQVAAEEGGYVWADGGVKYPRDVALALAAGASQVVVGSLFTPTYESPPPFQFDGDRRFKTNSGMASRMSSMVRTSRLDDEILEDDMRRVFRETVGHRSEGLNEGRVYQRLGQESASDVIHDIMDGVTSAMTYAGADNLEQFHWNARIAVQTQSGFDEGKPVRVLS